MNTTPIAFETTVTESKKNHYFSVKDLRNLIADVDDDTLVAIHRIEDEYFKPNGENGWKAIKALWDSQPIKTEKRLEETSEWSKDSSKCDPSQYEIITMENGEKVLKNYIDAIPAFQAYISKEKTANGQKLLVITPHY
ncbi:hypothetical protein GW796_08605 [archaeon]|nr:hypothetical protein [archaeon]